MKVVIINKSDSTGGAAVVSNRLLYALRNEGIDAKMLVVEKKLVSPYVEVAGESSAIRRSFISERLKIFISNGFNRSDLFKVDTASDGLALSRHPLVKEADVVCLNWVNQGMLSLKGVKRILELGKPVVWTMHDMWNMTGICHHAGQCLRWKEECGNCKFLGKMSFSNDLSHRVWKKKNYLYNYGGEKLHFVAVSNWLASLAGVSSLMNNSPLSVIGNSFPVEGKKVRTESRGKYFTILMGASRLDDPVKGLPVLVRATQVLRDSYAKEAEKIELVTFGNLKNPDSLADIAIRHRHLGMIKGEEAISRVYGGGDAVVSTSLYETLPGTLVEGQVYGTVPVSFNRGGQADIVEHKLTGYLADWSDDIDVAAANIAEGLVWAMNQPAAEIRKRMFESVSSRFDARVIARKYINLFRFLLDQK